MAGLTLGHGSGGRLTSELIGKILNRFDDANLQKDLEDCTMVSENLAMTVDSFTVSPRVFPGGDIGKLSICGSTNDLAVRGIRPEFISLAIVAEEGLEEEELLSYMKSAASTCSDLGVKLASGDTKVVPRGSVEGLFMSISAIGSPLVRPLGMKHLKPGDLVAVTTSIGRHGATIGAIRYDLETEGLESDCAALWPLVSPLLDIEGLRCMRDCTRGGLGTSLCEWAEGTGLGIEIEESSIPIHPGVISVCDILGFDPLHLASEGCAIVAFSPESEEKVMERLRSHHLGKDSVVIGKITEEHPGLVGMRTAIGGMRVVDMPVGELLPRIC